jgi:diguanylate cyclase
MFSTPTEQACRHMGIDRNGCHGLSSSHIEEVAAPGPLDNSDAALRELFASTLESVVGSLLITAPELRDEAHELGQQLRGVRDMSGVDDLAAKLRNLIYRLNWVVDDQWK